MANNDDDDKMSAAINRASQVPGGSTTMTRASASSNTPYGVIALPPGSRGPRSLYLRKQDNGSFGFTLRHFIVYPPEPLLTSGTELQPMETIFVKHVSESGKQAGLKEGDRIVAVNERNIAQMTYADVVNLIKKSPPYLHLLVVPKEDDVLQKYFLETAHNPETNQRPMTAPTQQPTQFHSQLPRMRVSQRRFSPQRVDGRIATNVAHHDDGIYYLPKDHIGVVNPPASHIYCEPYDRVPVARPQRVEITSATATSRCIAEPQVPVRNELKPANRRASIGSNVSKVSYESSGDYCSINSERLSDYDNVKGDDNHANTTMSNQTNASNQTNRALISISSDNNNVCNGSSNNNSAFCAGDTLYDQLNTMDSSKDSLNSSRNGSTSTLTGAETDDSAIMTRLRKSLEQKAEFLRASGDELPTVIQREFYPRPQKMSNPVWPPPSSQSRRPAQSVLVQLTKPRNYDLERVKSDVNVDRAKSTNARGIEKSASSTNYFASVHSPEGGGRYLDGNIPTTVSQFSSNDDSMSDKSSCSSPYPAVVHRRAKQFESGRSIPDDDDEYATSALGDRTSLYSSELSRLTSKRVVPNVQVRKKEFEQLSDRENKRQFNKIKGNSFEKTGIKGNSSIPIGSKNIHCLPPNVKVNLKDIDNTNDNHYRGRSNSTGTWVLSSNAQKNADDPATTSDNDEKQRHKAVRQDSYLAAVRGNASKNNQLVRQRAVLAQIDDDETMTATDFDGGTVLVGPTPARPTFLDLSLKLCDDVLHIDENRFTPDTYNADEPLPQIVKRTNLSDLGDEERATRRVSYLKATLGDCLLVDSESDNNETHDNERNTKSKTLAALAPSSNKALPAAFQRDNVSDHVSTTTKEGFLYCKVTLLDGKKATDRSWKQVWACLKGSNLYLLKNPTSPMGLSDPNCDGIVPTLDVRCSYVDVADDYTKRKNVFRVSSTQCGTEILLQADNNADMLHWVQTFKSHQLPSYSEESELRDARVQSVTCKQQQAVPQVPPSNVIGVGGRRQPSAISSQNVQRLSPLPANKSIRKLTSFRNRSPTGQSPVTKTRKSSTYPTNAPNAGPIPTDNLPSPKSNTWGKVVKQFRKIHGSANDPSSASNGCPVVSLPEGATIGVTLEQCPASSFSDYVPLLVEVCTNIVEDRGLDIVGIYRVPGNTGAISQLTDLLNKGFTVASLQDPRWNDVHVVSSLLKKFFRNLPEPLFTSDLYAHFIEADKIESPASRMYYIRELLAKLPAHHYETLKYLMQHLRRVIDNAQVNKMEAKNLAIVFGPTLIKMASEDMVAMINDMSHQCRIIELLLTNFEWFFNSDTDANLDAPPPECLSDNFKDTDSCFSSMNNSLLLNNVNKIGGSKASSGIDVAKVIKSTIISAAHRKINGNRSKPSLKRPNGKHGKELNASDIKLVNNSLTRHTDRVDEPAHYDVVDNSNVYDDPQRDNGHFVDKSPLRQQNIQASPVKGPAGTIKTYAGLSATTQERVRRFEQETREMLKRRNLPSTGLNVDEMTGSSTGCESSDFLSNYSSLSSMSSHSNEAAISSRLQPHRDYGHVKQDLNAHLRHGNFLKSNTSRTRLSVAETSTSSPRYEPVNRGSSIENIYSSTSDCNESPRSPNVFKKPANQHLKRLKTCEQTNDKTRYNKYGSLSSIDNHESRMNSGSEFSDDGSDLLTSLTTTFDRKLKTLLDATANEPDEPIKTKESTNEPRNPQIPKLFRNPSLHKSTRPDKYCEKENKTKDENEKETSETNDMPDNDKVIKRITKLQLKSNKLKRSESLNKTETTNKVKTALKRSESLNRHDRHDKLHRVDSLTKTEKTESNISKKREFLSGKRMATKLKRKSGAIDRSIKRRHTVGGTKDFDKCHWLDNHANEHATICNKSESTCEYCCAGGEKSALRTSSPDLTRRERLFLEISLLDGAGMIVSLHKHLFDAPCLTRVTRPHSLAESKIFKVPLESHV